MRRAHLALPLLLAAGPLWAQDITVQSSTFLRMWQEDIPNIGKRDHALGMQFLGIDATGLRSENLSLHLFGWGYGDLADASRPRGTSDGDLTYAFLRYRFDKANAELKAGRLSISQGGTHEWVDGVSGQADLRGGFTVSAFAGRPVLFRSQDQPLQADYEYQRDFIIGARLAKRIARYAEFGVSFLQDGTKPAHELDLPSAYDYTRRHVGLDVRLMGPGGLDLSGRTVWDVAKHPDALVKVEDPSRIAEHDYSLSARLGESVRVSGSYAQRNFRAYYAGTTMPTLFKPDERGTFTAYAGKVAWDATDTVQVVANVRQSSRESYGDANRVGAEVRWKVSGKKLQTGFGFHKVSADDVLTPGAKVAAYGLSHSEVRAWALYEKAKFTASLDGIFHRFDDPKNPVLNGKSSEFELIGSLGYKTTDNLRLSADLSMGANPLYKHETRALLRVEYRFGTTAKGDGK